MDSLYATGRFALRSVVRRDLQRLQAFAAELAGEPSAHLLRDLDTDEPLEPGYEELHPLGEVGRDEESEDVAVPMVSIEGMNLAVMSYGHDGYQWFLRSPQLDVWLNPVAQLKKPTVRVRLRPRLLWSEGPKLAWERVRRLVASLAVNIGEGIGHGPSVDWTVSRIDIAVDWMGGWRPRMEDHARVVARAHKKVWSRFPLAKTLSKKDLKDGVLDELVESFQTRHADTGLRIGKSGKIARLYDKTIEIFVKTKSPVADWQRAVWTTHGEIPAEALDPKSHQDWHVFRLEFELRGEALREFWVRVIEAKPRVRMTTPELVLRSVSDLWRYCTEAWLRLVDLTRTRRERCPTMPAWRMLSEWPRGEGEPLPGPRFHEQGRVDLARAVVGVATVETALPMVNGGLKTIAAAMGVVRPVGDDGSDEFDQAVFHWRQAGRKHLKLESLARVDEWKDEVYFRGLERSLHTGAPIPREARRTMMQAFDALGDRDINVQWSIDVAAKRRQIAGRRQREFDARFKGCDLSDPAIAQEVREMRSRWAKEDRRKRDFMAGKLHLGEGDEDHMLEDCG